MGANESAARGGHNNANNNMRSNNREYEEAVKSFSKEELENWKKRFFDRICGGGGECNEASLAEFTKPILTDAVFRKKLAATFPRSTNAPLESSKKKGKIKNQSGDSSKIAWESFLITISYFLKGSVDEKTRVFSALCCGDCNSDPTKKQISETLSALIRAYVSAESGSSEFATWSFVDEQLKQRDEESAISDYFLKEMNFDSNNETVPEAELCRWMGANWVLSKIIAFVIYAAFQFDLSKRDPDDVSFIPWTIPVCGESSSGHQSKMESTKTMLTASTLLILAHQMPPEYQRRWRNLFSISAHGESFSTLLRQIAGKGPTILLVKDEQGYIFGGFNSKSWELSSNFLGDQSCFVFSLFPQTAIYSPSGYNENYCYMNTNQQTLPNGLGFGGQLNEDPSHYFSLWLSQDFGRGSSQGSSVTYNSPQLSSGKAFRIKDLEVWAVDEAIAKPEGKAVVKSVLDVNPETKAILEMAGKTRHSDGLREPHPDDD